MDGTIRALFSFRDGFSRFVGDSPLLVPAGKLVFGERISTFNHPTCLRRMLDQLTCIGLHNIVVVDNASQFGPHLELLQSIEGQVSVLRCKENKGPRHLFHNAACYKQLPHYFCITDPDLEFNASLPVDFLEHLIGLTSTYRVGKAGFSLDISEPERMIAEPFQIGEQRYRIWEWEAQFWKTPLQDGLPDIACRALIDTTFALYTAEEAAFYQRTSRHSFYYGDPAEFLSRSNSHRHGSAHRCESGLPLSGSWREGPRPANRQSIRHRRLVPTGVPDDFACRQDLRGSPRSLACGRLLPHE